MTYLKKVLVNKYEEETDAALKEAAARSNAVVFPKVGIKDILEKEKLGLLFRKTPSDMSTDLEGYHCIGVQREKSFFGLLVKGLSLAPSVLARNRHVNDRTRPHHQWIGQM